MVDRLFDIKRERIRREVAEIKRMDDMATLERLAEAAEVCSEHPTKEREYNAAVLLLQQNGVTYFDDEALEEYRVALEAQIAEAEKEEQQKREIRKNKNKVIGTAVIYGAIAGLAVVGFGIYQESKKSEELAQEAALRDHLAKDVTYPPPYSEMTALAEQRELEYQESKQLRYQLRQMANTDCDGDVAVPDFLTFYLNSTGKEFPIDLQENRTILFWVDNETEGMQVEGKNKRYSISLSPDTAKELTAGMENPCKVLLE